MTIINLTPHDIRLVPPGYGEVVFPPSGQLARLDTKIIGAEGYAEVPVPVSVVKYENVDFDPPFRSDTWYIVSLVTALTARRPDFLVPFPELRDERGRVVGCEGFARVTV